MSQISQLSIYRLWYSRACDLRCCREGDRRFVEKRLWKYKTTNALLELRERRQSRVFNIVQSGRSKTPGLRHTRHPPRIPARTQRQSLTYQGKVRVSKACCTFLDSNDPKVAATMATFKLPMAVDRLWLSDKVCCHRASASSKAASSIR